jgi:hypothetical protein
MYKVKETFEYLVDDCNDFCSVQDVLDFEASLGSDATWADMENIPDHEYKSIPWGNSTIDVINNAVSINKDTLLQLIRDSEKLAALEAEGVDNWEGYSLAIRELNTSYQKDAITNEVLIKQYCE